MCVSLKCFHIVALIIKFCKHTFTVTDLHIGFIYMHTHVIWGISFSHTQLYIAVSYIIFNLLLYDGWHHKVCSAFSFRTTAIWYFYRDSQTLSIFRHYRTIQIPQTASPNVTFSAKVWYCFMSRTISMATF